MKHDHTQKVSITTSVVVPVYNASDCLDELTKRLRPVLDQACGSDGWEVLLIDDRSQDDSWVSLRRISSTDARFRAFRLSRNFGQEAATCAGFSMAQGLWIVTMDCDLQDRPEDIPLLLERANLETPMVRAVRDKSGFNHRVLGTRFYFWILNNIAGTNIDWREAAFGVMHRDIAAAYLSVGDYHKNMLMVLDWLGYSRVQVPVHHDERFAGESSYTLRHLFRYAASGVFFHTTRPLRWVIQLGFVLAVAGFVGAALIVVGQMTENFTYPGWASSMVVALSTSGITITAVGITGLYVARIFDQVRDRPRFIVDQLSDGQLPDNFRNGTPDVSDLGSELNGT